MRNKFFVLKAALTQSIASSVKMEDLGEKIIHEFRKFFRCSDVYLEVEFIQLNMSMLASDDGSNYLRYYLIVAHRASQEEISTQICGHIRHLFKESKIPYETVTPRDCKTICIEFCSPIGSF